MRFAHSVIPLLFAAFLSGCAASAPSAPCVEAPAVAHGAIPSEAEMTAEHEKLVAAYRTNDVATLERLLTADHIHNNVFGMQQGKDALLGDMRSGTLVFQSYEIGPSQWVRQPEMAIVTGTLRAQATRAGKPVPAKDFRYTRIFVKRNGLWQEWLFHNTMIVSPPTNPSN